MNLYGYTGFDFEKANKDWVLGLGLDKGFNEDEEMYEFEIIVLEDKREYEPIQKKDGKMFTPPSNDLEKFIVRSNVEIKDIKKLQTIKLVDVYDSYVMGAKTYSPTPVIMCEKIVPV